MSLSNYPPGVSDSTWDAPWNQSDPDEKEFEITCSQSLSRTATVWTSNYIPGGSGVDYEPDDEGGCYAVGWHEDDDTSETNWAEEYKANDYHTPLELIQILKGYVEKEATQYLEDHKDDHLSGKVCPAEKQWQYRSLLNLIEECDGWTEDDTEFTED